MPRVYYFSGKERFESSVSFRPDVDNAVDVFCKPPSLQKINKKWDARAEMCGHDGACNGTAALVRSRQPPPIVRIGWQQAQVDPASHDAVLPHRVLRMDVSEPAAV